MRDGHEEESVMAATLQTKALSTNTFEKGVAELQPQAKDVANAIDCLGRKQKGKFKPLMKTLYNEAGRISKADCNRIMDLLQEWIKQEKTDDYFVTVAKGFYNLVDKLELDTKLLKAKLASFIAEMTTWTEVLLDIEKQRVLKRLLLLALAKLNTEVFVAYWSSDLLKRKAKINSEILCDWIMEWSKKGEAANKQIWERFISRFVPTAKYIANSTVQSCHINWRQTIERKEKEVVETALVWNGNGARARWGGTAELKRVVCATDPDVFCFLESKTDIEKLLQLEDFENWLLKTGFCHLYCYWSKKDDGIAYGNEGILLFSKVKCEIKYGIDDCELDTQARVVTAEFGDCIFVFSYNPQGGFSEESLGFRAKWESSFGKFLDKTVAYAKAKDKKLIWAGDLNVNPSAKRLVNKTQSAARHSNGRVQRI
jgi:exonuclease III